MTNPLTTLVEIESRTGAIFAYEARRYDWGFMLTKLYDGEVYNVHLDERGEWECSCGDYIWRKCLLHEPCKHIIAVRELWDS